MGGHKLGYMNQSSTFLPKNFLGVRNKRHWNRVDYLGLGDPRLHVQDCYALRLGDDEF